MNAVIWVIFASTAIASCFVAHIGIGIAAVIGLVSTAINNVAKRRFWVGVSGLGMICPMLYILVIVLVRILRWTLLWQ